MSNPDATSEIAAVIYRYSTAMDTRQWQLMDEVFSSDVVGDLGGLVCNGRNDTVRFIRAAIECCERTRHMNGNIEAIVTGSSARVCSRLSAWHTGKDKTRDDVFLALGTYADEFVCTDAGWRIARREERTQIEVWLDGSRKRDLANFFATAFA
jgi:3-phenylpropionate/cinnamic acid dioxygenase small subunit